MKSMMDCALDYVAQGFRVLPLKPAGKTPLTEHGLKDATITQFGVKEYWSKWPEANIGISTDGFIVLDFDVKNGGLESKTQLIAKFGEFPRTRVHRTGGGGEHWIYRAPQGSNIRNGAGKYGYPGLDIRANGGYIVAPHSLHASGDRYEVIDDSPIVPAPAWILDLVTTEVVIPTPIGTNGNKDIKQILEGQRNTTLTSLAGTMQRRGMTGDAILAALRAENNTCCIPPLDDRELISIADSISRYASQQPAAEYNYLITDKNGNQTLDQDRLVRDLMTEFHFRTLEDTNQVLIYRDGVYHTGGDQFIRAECQRRVGLRSLLTEHRVNEIEGHIRRSTFTKRAEFNRSGAFINLQNGLLNISTRTLVPHAPDFLSTVQLPIAFRTETRGLRISRFLNEILKPSDIPLITEFFGFCLLAEYRIQKAFLLVGEGANGKSTLIKLLMAFVGEANCSHVSWQQLEMNRFAMADLEGKLVNSFADLPSHGMSTTTAFKMLTGGDSISAERKFMPSFNFVNFAKLIFSTNKPPKVDGEDSFAFWRRWIIVEFPNSFTGNKDNPNLIDELTSDEELSGLLNLSLDGLDRLRVNKAFTYGRSVEETSEYYLRTADPVYAFIQDCCEIGPGCWVSKEDCYNAFKANCEAKQIPLLRPNSFARALQNQTTVRISATRPQINGSRIYAWQGIRLADTKSDGDEQNRTEPRLPSRMSGQNDTSNAYTHEDITLKLQNNVDNPDATLKTDSPKSDGASQNPDGKTVSILGISVEEALTIWRKQGAPLIHLGQAENCEDLEKLLTKTIPRDYQLQAIKSWLDKNKDTMSRS